MGIHFNEHKQSFLLKLSALGSSRLWCFCLLKARVLTTLAFFFARVSQKWSQREPGYSRAIWQYRQRPALLHKRTCTLTVTWFELYSVHLFRAKKYKHRPLWLLPGWAGILPVCRVSRNNWFKTRLAEGRESGARAELQSAPLQPTGTAQQEMRSAEPSKAPP